MDDSVQDTKPSLWVRRIAPFAWILPAVGGGIALVDGNTAAGVGFLALAVGGLYVPVRWRAERGPRNRKLPPLDLIKAFAFFAAVALGGFALFLLAVLGQVPVASGVLGLPAAVVAVYLLVRGVQIHGRH